MIGQIESVADLEKWLTGVKSSDGTLVSNLFYNRWLADRWITRRALFGERIDGTVILLRRDRDFWHLYFSATSTDQLLVALRNTELLNEERIVADILGTETQIEALGGTLAKVGFANYAELARFSLLGPTTNSDDVGLGVERARREDAPELLEMLERTFDRYAEQIPTVEELETAASGDGVIVVRGEAGIVGMLFFEDYGKSSTIRYWLVLDSGRGSGIGSRMLRKYFQEHRYFSRFTLWVRSDNLSAIEKYRHYGFRPDGLRDRVMCNGKLNTQ